MYRHALVARKRLEYIAHNYEVSSHARERLKERRAVGCTIKESILKSPLAWRVSDGTIKIALGKKEFIVVEDTTETRTIPKIITFIRLQYGTVVHQFIRDCLGEKQCSG